MIDKVAQLFRGAATVAGATLHTNVDGKTTVVTSIAVTNASATSATYTLAIAGVEYAAAVLIAPNTTHIYDDVRQVLTGTQAITGQASATAVKFHLAGAVA